MFDFPKNDFYNDYKIKFDVDCLPLQENPTNSPYYAQVQFQTDLLPGKRYRTMDFWLGSSGFSRAAEILMKTSTNGSGIPMIGGFYFNQADPPRKDILHICPLTLTEMMVLSHITYDLRNRRVGST